MKWRVKEEASRQQASADETCWRVPLVADDDSSETSILIGISGSAMAIAEDYLPARVAEMRRTQGLSQVEFYLGWKEPPKKITGHSAGIHVELADGTIVQTLGVGPPGRGV